MRIAMAGSTPLIFSTVMGIAWSVRSGDVQTAFTVAGFILTAGTCKLPSDTLIVGFLSSLRGRCFSVSILNRTPCFTNN